MPMGSTVFLLTVLLVVHCGGSHQPSSPHFLLFLLTWGAACSLSWDIEITGWHPLLGAARPSSPNQFKFWGHTP